MAVQAQFGGFAGCMPLPLPCGGSFAEEQVRAPLDMDYGALLSSAAANNGYHCCPGVVVSGAQSELTCNGSAGGGVLMSRKRGRDADHFDQYVSSPSAALLPIPTMVQNEASRVVDSAAASTSGRPVSAHQDAVALPELWRRQLQQGAEIDALVRAECERMRAGIEQARKRQCQALVSAVVGHAAQRLREKEAELDGARRRAAELEARLRQAAAESQAWQGAALTNEAVAAELRAALEHHHLLLQRGAAAPGDAVDGFGESDPAGFPPAPGADDAQSCCFEAKDTDVATATSSPAGKNKWACKACGEGEATVLLLPCRHLCLCKSCEPKMDTCPVCLAVKNASIHVATH